MNNVKIILIVDDDEDDRSLFIDAVKKIDASIKCVSACDGEEALKYLRAETSAIPDIIFLDLNMPRFNGKECLVAIKKIPHLQNIPVIIYSTTSRPEDVKETLSLGAAQFLTKPTYFENICKEVSSIFSKEWHKNMLLI